VTKVADIGAIQHSTWLPISASLYLCHCHASFQIYSETLDENCGFFPPHVYLAPPLGATPFKLQRDLVHQKSRVPRQPCSTDQVSHI